MAKICLVMILKNEAPRIERAVATAIPYIDSWCICDTGSTDGTQQKVRELLGHLPGVLHEVPWVNYGFNRQQVIELADAAPETDGNADYYLILDGDLSLVVLDPTWKEQLTADAYGIRYDGSLDYTNTRLVTSQLDWKYRGKTHEYIHCAGVPHTYEEIKTIQIHDWSDGAQTANLYGHIKTLIADLDEQPEGNPDTARDVFYIAQSYRGLRRFTEAIYWYNRRTTMTGSWEEAYYSMYMMGLCQAEIGYPWEVVEKNLLLAHKMRPERHEAIFEVIRQYRTNGDKFEGDEARKCYEKAVKLAKGVWDAPYPSKDIMLVMKPIYLYYLPYEVGKSAFMIKQFDLARRCFEKALGCDDKAGVRPEDRAELDAEMKSLLERCDK